MTAISISAQKTEFRARFRNWRPAEQDNQNLVNILGTYFSSKKGIWGCFAALSNEISLSALYKKTTNIQWAFPKIMGENLEYYIPGADGFESGPLGVQEPVTTGAQKVDIQDLDGVLVPGLAFDLHGTRLGRGKGFYDKNFKDFKKQTVGIAHHDQVFQRLPHEDFDLKVRNLATDRGILHFY